MDCTNAAWRQSHRVRDEGATTIFSLSRLCVLRIPVEHSQKHSLCVFDERKIPNTVGSKRLRSLDSAHKSSIQNSDAPTANLLTTSQYKDICQQDQEEQWLVCVTRLGGDADESREERHQRDGTGHEAKLRVPGMYIKISRDVGQKSRGSFLVERWRQLVRDIDRTTKHVFGVVQWKRVSSFFPCCGAE